MTGAFGWSRIGLSLGCDNIVDGEEGMSIEACFPSSTTRMKARWRALPALGLNVPPIARRYCLARTMLKSGVGLS